MSPSDHRGISFRTKLVLALLAVVAPVLIVALLALHRETDRQIQTFITTSLTTAQGQLAQVELIRQRELRHLAMRFAGSNRWPDALLQAIEGDTAHLRTQIEYELTLAGVTNALAAFIDLDGNAVYATVAGRPLADPATAVPVSVLERLVQGDTAVFGYHPLGAELFLAHPVVLEIVTQPTGFLVLGTPLDDGVARLIGNAIGAQVCFAAGDRCVASTEGAMQPALAREILNAARDSANSGGRAEVDGHTYAFVTQPLAGNAATVVLALSLDQVLAPFRRIQQTLLAVAVVALVLAILLALALGHGLAVPVRQLVRATKRVAGGDYDTRVEVRSRDELGTLADAFNQMTYGLMLKDRYRGVLDKVVSRDIADELLKGEIALGGENREVTMLFADIRGFTPLTEGMEPQAVIGLLNEIMEHLGTAVESEGGVVDKYVGDEVMALFGAPIAREDDAERAIRAALRMQRDIGELNEHRARAGLAPIGLGIGINTGHVVAGNMGSQKRMNYTVLGDAVNLAARLCSAARPGEIIVTRETLALVGDRYRATRLGEQAIKGFSSAIELFRIEGPGVPVAAGA